MMKSVMAVLSGVSVLTLGACQKSESTTNETTNTTTTTTTTSASSAGDINGTWVADLASVQIDAKPDQYLLNGGKFSCPTCTPPLTLAADGAFHAVTGRPYADEMSVKADDDHNVTRNARKGGRDTGQTKYSVSADGKTLTVSFTDSSTPNVKPVTGNYTETRVAAGPAGSNAISGSWKLDKYTNISQEGLTVTYKVDGDTLHMSSPAGTSYDAKLDGTDAPINGDIGGTTASVKKLADGSYEETDKRGGKVISVTTFTTGADGKMHVVNADKQSGTTVKYDANKQ